jgi:hypothetical protein
MNSVIYTERKLCSDRWKNFSIHSTGDYLSWSSSVNFIEFGLNENEQDYFAFAKHFMNPVWIPDPTSETDLPGTGIIVESFVGLGLRYLSF